jgi:hypothetical protein
MLTKRIVSLASASSKAVQARPTVNASTRRQGSVLKSYAKTENPMSFRSVQMMVCIDSLHLFWEFSLSLIFKIFHKFLHPIPATL